MKNQAIDESDEENFPTPMRPGFQSSGRAGRAPLLPSAYHTGSTAPGSIAIDIPGFKSSPSDQSNLKARISTDSTEGLQVWREVTNMDRFLEQLYQYYYGKGQNNTVLSRVCSILTVGFVVVFGLFLQYCIDWSFLWKPASEAEHPKLWNVVKLGNIFGMSFFMYMCTVIFLTIWSWQAYLLLRDIPRLQKMKLFFEKVLLVKEDELETFDFNEIVNKLITLQSIHPVVPGSLDACEIVNRMMRRENYLIALFNKDIVDLSIPLPFVKSQALTKTLEWNLSFAILSYIFDENLVVKRSFLKESNRGNMSEGLIKRIQLLAFINLLLSPFICVFLVVHFIFKYGEEAYKNPKVIGDRQYTAYARWKLREFNELPHFFDRRLMLSHKKANRYMEQFHNEKLATIGRFVAFIAGSICAILIFMTIANEELLMHFEITPGKSIIWYLAFFGAVLAISRGLVPDPARLKDPAELMKGVQEFTHYMPEHWKSNLQSVKVREEFGQLYQYQMINFIQELSSVIFTPYILWFSLPSKAQNIVEFFREFTVHVDKLGYVCSFALFDFKRHGDPKYGGVMKTEAATGKYYRSKQGKMEKSFLSFAKNYPDWTPPEQGSIYISNLRDFGVNQSVYGAKASRILRPPKEESKRDDAGSDDSDVGIMALLNEYCEYRQNSTAS